MAVAITTAVALAGAALAAPVPYSSTASNTWGADGPVHASVIVGDTVIIGGNFANLVTPSGQRLARRNLAAISLSTGAPVSGFRADTNGEVRSLVSDGTRLFVGGYFTSIGGASRSRLAVLNPATGAVTSQRFEVAGTVEALHLAGPRLYIGGEFTHIAGVARPRMGLVDVGTGAVISTFTPNFDGTVHGIATAASGTRVFAAGSFFTVGGRSRRGIVELTSTGAPTAAAFVNTESAWTVAANTTGSVIYAGIAGKATLGNRIAAYDTATGSRRWFHEGDGDVQALRILGGNVYFGFHEGFGGDTTLKLLAADLDTGAIEWSYRVPLIGFWGVWSITGDDSRLVVGGDFTVQGSGQRNLAVFPFVGMPRPPAPEPEPVPPGAPLVPFGATWRYAKADSPTQATWMHADFNDAGWARGPAELGFGDGDEATVIPSGGASFRFRTSFALTTLPERLELQLVADDGAVVYLNGVEVARDNMPTGAIGAGTLAASNRSGVDESLVRAFTLPTAALRTGTNVLAIGIHQDCLCSSDASMNAALVGSGTAPDPGPGPEPTGPFVAMGATWKYSKADSTALGVWTQPTFNDGAWAAGPAELGFGDGDESTVIPSGGASFRFRRTFTVGSTLPSRLTLKLVADDGAVVFINGTEVARDNLPAGTITGTTLAASNRWGAAESAVRSFTLDPQVLRTGQVNTIAVSVHQDCLCSSDLSFNLELAG